MNQEPVAPEILSSVEADAQIEAKAKADAEAAAPNAESAEAAEPAPAAKDKRFWNRKDADKGEEAPKKAYVEELEKKLADKEQRLKDTLVQYKEALDEFEGAKARLRRDIGKEIESGKRSMLADLLDVVDNLERAVGSTQPQTDVASLLNGVTMVRDQFLSKLEALGVRRFNAMNMPFDPSRCEAVSIVPVPDSAQDGMVVGVVRDCYLMGNETLRHGMVAVGKGPTTDVQAPKEQQPN